jgi:hypothetical protein
MKSIQFSCVFLGLDRLPAFRIARRLDAPRREVVMVITRGADCAVRWLDLPVLHVIADSTVARVVNI